MRCSPDINAMEDRSSVIIWIVVTISVMFVLPFAVARFASECAGMALCIILFFIVNPCYSLVLGYKSGNDIRRMGILPLFSSIFFLVGTWLFFDIQEPWFIVYAIVYLLIGYTAMAVSRYVSKPSKQKNRKTK